MGTINKGFEFDGPPGSTLNEVKSIRIPNGQKSSQIVEGIPGEAGRQQWDRPVEFLLSCISMSVGLGNLWRFPYRAYANGGGAFLIPYLIVLFFIGKPLYFLELSIGQFSSKGQVKVWKMAPLFKGVGYGSAFGMACVVSYYCPIMAITVYYFIQSFNTVLPWSECNPDWATHNVTCMNNNTEAISPHNKSISELYFKIDVLHEKDQIEDGIGYPDWRLTLCLLFSWVIVLVSLIKGVRSAGKVAYFTALFPYVVLFVLLIRGVTLEGAIDGIWYFIKPEWSRILEVKVWQAAISQCFYSLGVGFGVIIMLGSYNPFTHNVYRDAMIISLTDTCTSLLAGFTIFAVLGNLAHQNNLPISEVAGDGPALAFVSYPRAISQFTFMPQLFAVLFFLMLFTLGIGSQTPMVGGLITVIHDQFPKVQKVWITVGVCVVGFFSGLVYVTPGGQWVLGLVDNFGGGFVIYIMATLEIIGVAWVYGLGNICRDIEFMLKDKVGSLSVYWRFCWGLFIPFVLIVILIQSLIGIGDFDSYEENKPYPIKYLAFGYGLALFAILLVPLWALHSIFKTSSETLGGKLKESIRPTADWGPDSSTLRDRWLQESSQNSQQESPYFSIKHLKRILTRSAK